MSLFWQAVLDTNDISWVHGTGGYTNCYTGNTWNHDLCPDDETCAENCALEGADYEATYGITTSGDSLRLNFVTQSQQKNIGSRTYLMEDENTYQIFNLLNKEFTFDVDVSNLACGLNGALYFVTMDADGGKSKYANNKAGAKYGVGYCDSQCPRDLKFINGLGNVEGWQPSDSDPNAGIGGHGSCCSEMDIWEANSISNAVTPHPCDQVGQTMCQGDKCGGTYSGTRYGGNCDPDGCDFNPFRMGNESFFGPGKTLDTNSKMTVVTQFITDDGSDSGTLSKIKRFYVQDGTVFAQPESNVDGVSGNAIDTEFCQAQKDAFGDQNVFAQHGGMSQMGAGIEAGMVLVMSLWDDHYAHMLWLDSDYPTDADPSQPGISRGTCPTDSGKPEKIESSHASDHVVFSNIKFGPIGSTYGHGNSGGGGGGGGGGGNDGGNGGNDGGNGGNTGGGTAAHWAQCGGKNYNGPTQCASPYTCHEVNPYYSQCL